jgi:NAD+ synthase
MLASKIGVPLEIINKPPTAGLWAGQTDEEELGITYELLDKILYLMIDKNLDDKEVAQKLEIPFTEVLRIKMKINNSLHKSEPAHSPGLRK